jgi:mRNA-degrading endonuclease RelE of RelBE toxin-antitoxin system
VRFRRTERFATAYRSLSANVQRKVDKALRLLAADPRHPSLRLKKIEGADRIWEARVDRSHRLTLEIAEGCCLLRNVGKHDETLERP